MFTGIVSELGQVVAVREIAQGRRVTIAASSTLHRLGIGDSVAVNGACLTVTERDTETFSVEAVRETLERTTIGALEEGSAVNLERPMPADGRFDGHIVQGHVDGVGVIRSITGEGEASRVRVEIPSELARYIVEKGSITVDGTSLTVTDVSDRDADDQWFEVVLIPHTLEVTAFGLVRSTTPVNLEVDVIAKYVERILGPVR
jgi:riboflavin synthase